MRCSLSIPTQLQIQAQTQMQIQSQIQIQTQIQLQIQTQTDPDLEVLPSYTSQGAFYPDSCCLDGTIGQRSLYPREYPALPNIQILSKAISEL